eukprot:914990_1
MDLIATLSLIPNTGIIFMAEAFGIGKLSKCLHGGPKRNQTQNRRCISDDHCGAIGNDQFETYVSWFKDDYIMIKDNASLDIDKYEDNHPSFKKHI